VAAASKKKKYVVRASRYIFKPIVAETLRAFNASARQLLLADLGQSRPISINVGKAKETSYLFQRIYVIVQS